MTLRALLCAGVATLAACSSSPDRPAATHVPASWTDVRQAAGHQVHVATNHIACTECHGEGLAPPPGDLCTACHAEIRATIHLDSGLATIVPRPQCQDCHGFVDREIRPTACMRCHDRAQGRHLAVGAHRDERCGDCHRAHATPSLAPPPCESCHEAHRTAHAGMRGCRDCHSVHETATAADARCATCHAKLRGAAHVELRHSPTGSIDLSPHSPGGSAAHPGDSHRKCTTCHRPHAFGKTETARCDSCHTAQRPPAATKHGACTTCHAPHDAAQPRPCASCHVQRTSHPEVGNHAVANPCATCHSPHTPNAVVTCDTCHAKQPTHSKAACQDCHKPHAATPTLTAALCATCHAEVSRRAAGSGHATCTNCHVEAAHAPSKPSPRCPTCHVPEATTAPRGHQTCADCHDTHASARPAASCSSCHVDKPKTSHGTQICATCHRAHGSRAADKPTLASRTCAGCHPPQTLPGLHASSGHQTCAACHRAHELAPRDDRTTCTGTCHRAQAGHEPTAIHCATCHPFGN